MVTMFLALLFGALALADLSTPHTASGLLVGLKWAMYFLVVASATARIRRYPKPQGWAKEPPPL